MGAQELQQTAALAALSATDGGILARGLLQIGNQIAAAKAAQCVLTPQDGKKQLLILAAERIEGATFSPREGGAAASTIQQVLTDLRIVHHGQPADITAGSLACHVRGPAQKGNALEERKPVEDALALTRAPATHAEDRRAIDDDFNAQHLGELVVHLDHVAEVAVLDAETHVDFLEIGKHFAAAGGGTLAAEIAQDILAAQVQAGLLEQARIQAGQGVGALKEDVQSKLGLVRDPAVRQALEQVAEQRIAALGQNVEEAGPFFAQQLVGQLLGQSVVADGQEGVVALLESDL